MEKIFYSVICALLLLGCSNDKQKENSDPDSVGEMSSIVFSLSDGTLDPASYALKPSAGNPLSEADIAKYIQNVRLLVFDAQTKVLIHQASWTNIAAEFKTRFRMVANKEYEYIIVTNTDITGCFTHDLINGLSTKDDIMMMLKRVIDVGAPAGNGDSGCRYQFYTRSAAPTDVNHLFFGSTVKQFAVPTETNVVNISIKRVMAMINFEVKINNPAFQAPTADAPAYLNQLTFDVSRMACALDMSLAQKLKSQSNYDDCVVRGGAFSCTEASSHTYSSTAFVFGNGKDAFLTFNLKTQKAEGSLAAGKDRIFWIDLEKLPIVINKKYNIKTTIPAGNFGGDPSNPNTINPENPTQGTSSLEVVITVDDWDKEIGTGGGDLQ